MSRLFHSIRRPSLQSFSWERSPWIRRSNLSPSHTLGRQRQEHLRGWWHQKRQWLKDLLKHPLILGGFLWVTLFLWNWIMAVAIALGTTVAVGVYLAQLDRLHVNWHPSLQPSRWRLYHDTRSSCLHLLQYLRQDCWLKWWTPANRPFSLSILIGGSTAAIVGSVALIYNDTQSLSLALIVGGQFLLTVGLGGYVGWQTRSQSSPLSNPAPDLNHCPDPSSPSAPQSLSENSLDTVWADLASDHPPTRLIAIYRVVNWVQTHSSPQVLPVNHLMACFRLMLTHERQPTVQQALREALMTLQEQASVCSMDIDEPV